MATDFYYQGSNTLIGTHKNAVRVIPDFILDKDWAGEPARSAERKSAGRRKSAERKRSADRGKSRDRIKKMFNKFKQPEVLQTCKTSTVPDNFGGFEDNDGGKYKEFFENAEDREKTNDELVMIQPEYRESDIVDQQQEDEALDSFVNMEAAIEADAETEKEDFDELYDGIDPSPF